MIVQAAGQEFRVDTRRPAGALRRGGEHLTPRELDALVRIDDVRSALSVLVTMLPLAATLLLAVVFWSLCAHGGFEVLSARPH